MNRLIAIGRLRRLRCILAHLLLVLIIILSIIHRGGSCFTEDLLLMKHCVTEFFGENIIIHDLADAMTQDWELAELVYRRPQFTVYSHETPDKLDQIL